MSSPPQTPMHRPTSSHRRHPSSLDIASNTPSRQQSLNRRSSGYSQITPRSSQDFEQDSPAQHFDGAGDGNGLGNLADELGEIWDDDEEPMDGEFGEDLDVTHQDDLSGIGTAVEHDGSYGLDSPVNVNGVRDSGVAMQSSSPSRLSPGSAMKTRKHTRTRSLYDGSDYGEDSDLENEGISHTLDMRMSAIESLVRRGTEDNGSASDQVVKRVIERLRDLGSQMAIENGATRLKTAHDALTTHLTHQSRTLTSLAASFSGPRPIIPDLDTIEDLLPLIDSTLELLPHASTDPLVQFSHLTNSTRELLQHLANVSDTLHMLRQITTNATRRLKVSKEQLQDWKRENEKTQEGQDYIEHGDWDRRLREREAKRACDNVLDGFEDVCGQWRKRLCEGLGVANVDLTGEAEEAEDPRPAWRTFKVPDSHNSLSEQKQTLSLKLLTLSDKPQLPKRTSTDSMFPAPSEELASPTRELQP